MLRLTSIFLVVEEKLCLTLRSQSLAQELINFRAMPFQFL